MLYWAYPLGDTGMLPLPQYAPAPANTVVACPGCGSPYVTDWSHVCVCEWCDMRFEVVPIPLVD